jgi:sigma-B regulation protein RsbU (phosphoserine phosphatase)
VDYITKPFQLEEVLARVETHLALRQLQKQLQDANTRFENELALAAEIQASFLPGELPEIAGWQLRATLIPARETSGDFYDVIPLPNGRLGLVVADVTDKGTGAALYMALSRTLLRTYAVENDTRPDLAFNAAHRRIIADTNSSQFVTVFYGVLDPVSGTLTYANAGHNPPYLFSAHNRADASAAVQELTNTGPPLGLRMFKDTTWERRQIALSPGDVLVAYSDGVTEAQDGHGEFFEEERLLDLMQANLGAQERHGPSAQGIEDTILSTVHEFVGEAPQQDDITLMVLVRQVSSGADLQP